MHLSQPSHLWDYNTTSNCLHSFSVYNCLPPFIANTLATKRFFFSSLFPFKHIPWKYVSKQYSYKHIWLHYFSSFYSGNFDCTPVIYFDFSSHWSMHIFRWKFRITCFVVHSTLNLLYLTLLPIVRSSTLTLKLRFSLLLLWFCLWLDLTSQDFCYWTSHWYKVQWTWCARQVRLGSRKLSSLDIYSK